MSDDGNKSEQPTDKKIRDARKEGQVGFSKDLSTCVTIASGFIMVSFLKDSIIKNLNGLFDVVFLNFNQQLDIINISKIASSTFSTFMNLIFIIVGVGAFATMITTIAQYGGFLVTNKLFKFDLQKFNVVSNLKNILSKKNFMKFILNCIKILIMLYIGYSIFKKNLPDIILLKEVNIAAVGSFIYRVIITIVIVLIFLFFTFGIIDLIMEKRNILKQLMMSMEEVKREYKESDGDPEVKHARKELHRELLEEDNHGGENSSNTFVIANPTHIAVVILYKPMQWPLPIILMMDKGENAHAIFNYAKKHNIPIFRDKWLARQLFSFGKVKDFVPSTLVQQVGELIAKNINQLPNIALEIQKIEMNNNQVKVYDQNTLNPVTPKPPLNKNNIRKV